MKKHYLLWIIVISILQLIGCNKRTVSSSKPIVFVSILPQKFFVEKIAGNKADVQVMVRPGFSPATYEPLPGQLEKLDQASMYFRIHVPFETAWFGKIKNLNPKLKIIDTRVGIKLRTIESSVHFENGKYSKTKKEHECEQNRCGAEHHHGKKDPHIWLSPKLVKIQAENICKAFVKHDGKNSFFYKKNLQKFIGQLDLLHKNIAARMMSVKQKKMMVFHPSWGYFADEFGFKQIPIEISGKQPTAKDLINTINYARGSSIKIIFVQKQFSTREATTIATAIQGKVVQIDPLAPNYVENLMKIAKVISTELEK